MKAYEIGGKYSRHGEMRNSYKILSENLKRRG
jgi:hypothetical protein